MEKLNSNVEKFVEEVVDLLNENDESVISIVTTKDHTFAILDILEEFYQCSTDLVQWDDISQSKTNIICIFNQGETGLISAQSLYNAKTERPYVIGADYTFVDVDVELDFISHQENNFKFTIFDLEPEKHECNGDCCNCEFYEEESVNSDLEEKLVALISAAIDFGRYFKEE